MIGIALQYQFLKAICEGETYDHLSECNIADKPQATEKFREMLSKGKSVNWKTVLKVSQFKIEHIFLPTRGGGKEFHVSLL